MSDDMVEQSTEQEAIAGFLQHVETMDLAWLGVLMATALHAFVRRAGDADRSALNREMKLICDGASP